MTSRALGSTIFRRSAPVAFVMLLLTVSWPLYVHLTNHSTLVRLDYAAEATSVHTPLPSEMAVVHSAERHALYLTSGYPEAVAAALLEMPSLQLETAFMEWWTLPLSTLLMMAYIRRRISSATEALLTTLGVAGTALIATNGIVATIAVWWLGEPVLLALRSALWISFAMTVATVTYASCFAFLHHHFGSVSWRWWILSILTLTLAWSIRTALPSLGYASAVPFLPGGVERFLFDPAESKVMLGFAICLGWSAIFMATCIKQRQPADASVVT